MRIAPIEPSDETTTRMRDERPARGRERDGRGRGRALVGRGVGRSVGGSGSAHASAHRGINAAREAKPSVPRPVVLPSVRAETGTSVDARAVVDARRTWGGVGRGRGGGRGVDGGRGTTRADEGGGARDGDVDVDVDANGGVKRELALAGATWARRDAFEREVSSGAGLGGKSGDAREYPALGRRSGERGDGAGDHGREDDRGIGSEIVRDVRLYAGDDGGARRSRREDEDERYVGPSPAESRGRGGGGRTFAPRALFRPRGGDGDGGDNDDVIPGMEDDDSRRRRDEVREENGNGKTDEAISAARVAYEEEIRRIMDERAGHSTDIGDEESSATMNTSPERRGYDPMAPPKVLIKPSALASAGEDARSELTVAAAPARVERNVDTPGSDLLQSRGAGAPVVLRRPTPPAQPEPAVLKPEPVVVLKSAVEADDKGRKKRGGKKVREREERRASRAVKESTAVHTKRGAASGVSRAAESDAKAYAGGAYVAHPGIYAVPFSDATGGLYAPFTPGYPAGYVTSGYYGFQSAQSWTSAESATSDGMPYPYIAPPVTVPANAPFDINATGTYGASAAEPTESVVNHLTKRLDNLPTSLGAEFGSTDDLSAFADEYRLEHARSSGSPLAARGHRYDPSQQQQHAQNIRAQRQEAERNRRRRQRPTQKRDATTSA